MAPLTARDKRTVRIAGILVACYLALFYGARGWKHLEARRSEYQSLLQQAQNVKADLQRYENKVLLMEKLKKNSKLEFSGLTKPALVGQASAALQQAAQEGGIKLGPIRESPGSSATKELATMQLEATGPVPAIMTLLHRLETLGFPLVVDSVQVDADAKTPGTVKVSLRLVLLDFNQWKKEDKQRV